MLPRQKASKAPSFWKGKAILNASSCQGVTHIYKAALQADFCFPTLIESWIQRNISLPQEKEQTRVMISEK